MKVKRNALNQLKLMICKLKRPIITREGFALCQKSDLFDAEWYIRQYPDVKTKGINPLEHYLRFGGIEGRDPSSEFSSQWYMDTYEDVKKSGINPLLHYLLYGRNEGRKPKE